MINTLKRQLLQPKI